MKVNKIFDIKEHIAKVTIKIIKLKVEITGEQIKYCSAFIVQKLYTLSIKFIWK